MTTPLPPPLQWPVEAIRAALAPTLSGVTVEVLPEIDSSNTELMRRFRGSPGIAPRTAPTLLVAEQQTAGRGRMGRQWQSRRGDSLTFSLGLPLQPADWSGLSLVAGISLAESLDPGHVSHDGNSGGTRVGLKWPNDLWLCSARGERKLAGILVETASWDGIRYVVIGVGINIRAVALAADAAAHASAVAMPAGCLQDVFPGMDAAAALLRIAPPLVQAVQAFEHFGFAPFQARFARRDVLAGRTVRLSDGTQGTAHGAGEHGALLVHTAAGMKEITSSEVSVRPVHPSAPAAVGANAPQGVRPC